MTGDLARNENMVIAAESLKQLYDEYVRVGFSEEQSFELIKKAMECGFYYEE